MAYDNPDRRLYQRQHDFGAASEIFSVRGPSGKQGILRLVAVAVTETFTATTTQGFVRVGTAADNDAFAELQMGTAADEDYWDSDTDDTNAIIDSDIPADTLVEVNLVAPTGGTPAGQGEVHIMIDWV